MKNHYITIQFPSMCDQCPPSATIPNLTYLSICPAEKLMYCGDGRLCYIWATNYIILSISILRLQEKPQQGTVFKTEFEVQIKLSKYVWSYQSTSWYTREIRKDVRTCLLIGYSEIRRYCTTQITWYNTLKYTCCVKCAVHFKLIELVVFSIH